MTKEQFLIGTPFYIGRKRYDGDSTYYFNNGHISRQIRSSIDEKIILDNYECNIVKIGRLGFTGLGFVLGKEVVVKYQFSDLVPYETETSTGE